MDAKERQSQPQYNAEEDMSPTNDSLTPQSSISYACPGAACPETFESVLHLHHHLRATHSRRPCPVPDCCYRNADKLSALHHLRRRHEIPLPERDESKEDPAQYLARLLGLFRRWCRDQDIQNHDQSFFDYEEDSNGHGYDEPITVALNSSGHCSQDHDLLLQYAVDLEMNPTQLSRPDGFHELLAIYGRTTPGYDHYKDLCKDMLDLGKADGAEKIGRWLAREIQRWLIQYPFVPQGLMQHLENEFETIWDQEEAETSDTQTSPRDAEANMPTNARDDYDYAGDDDHGFAELMRKYGPAKQVFDEADQDVPGSAQDEGDSDSAASNINVADKRNQDLVAAKDVQSTQTEQQHHAGSMEQPLAGSMQGSKRSSSPLFMSP